MKNTVHCTTPGVHFQWKFFIHKFLDPTTHSGASISSQPIWVKSKWKIKKINYNSPAVDQKRRQTTWIEVHQWLLKPELSMERPLLVIVPAFQSILDRSPQKWSSPRSKKPCPNRLLRPARLGVVLDQLLSKSPSSAIAPMAAWFNFQRPSWS